MTTKTVLTLTAGRENEKVPINSTPGLTCPYSTVGLCFRDWCWHGSWSTLGPVILEELEFSMFYLCRTPEVLQRCWWIIHSDSDSGLEGRGPAIYWGLLVSRDFDARKEPRLLESYFVLVRFPRSRLWDGDLLRKVAAGGRARTGKKPVKGEHLPKCAARGFGLIPRGG